MPETFVEWRQKRTKKMDGIESYGIEGLPLMHLLAGNNNDGCIKSIFKSIAIYISFSIKCTHPFWQEMEWKCGNLLIYINKTSISNDFYLPKKRQPRFQSLTCPSISIKANYPQLCTYFYGLIFDSRDTFA